MQRAPAKIEDGKLIIDLPHELNADHIETVTRGNGQLFVDFEIADPRRSRPQQRRLFFALLNDITRHFWWVGADFLKAMFYNQFYFYTAGKEISLSNDSESSVSDVNQLLDLVIDFMFEWHVPFKKGYELLPKDEQYYLYECLRHRVCCICGQEHADIHHYQAVGNRSRKQVDHRKLSFICLCRKHHELIHSMGGQSFLDYFHVKPITLGEDDLINLRIMTKKQMDYWDARYARK
ncbi:putative HNHc nuclease [Lentilactobacillus sp. SPB1-3]|uniref:HNHc nuclease n=1 Tax=Lentilactobacillus terminaliae TaxID=3003483 RepID=A0ACD5DCN3_9LACO|nr:putative HNHc nuclease [Lentilactobacillus sp. SPB1-3]MCZ0978065.1 putative HNHc nuclease [Lentilactobacillus sp. SPB1-3]